MRILEKLRLKYCAPDTSVEAFENESLIAESPLEDLVDGGEWEWEV